LSAACHWSVTVDPTNGVELDLEISPAMSPGPVRRCIVVELFENCITPPTQSEATIEFGHPLNLPGRAKNVLLKVPPGQYLCITARDPLHTLRSGAELEIIDGRYEAVFQGEPFFGGNWLAAGNLNGDRVIDIMDFTIYDEQEGTVLTPHTPCGVIGPHADINGDGLVDLIDLEFIERHQGRTDTGLCCPDRDTAMAPEPKTDISVRVLELFGLSHLTGADRNGDGVVNIEDIHLARRALRHTKPDRGLDRQHR
jgi:hypothetical protein